jgi:hypothetical protein
MAGNKFLKVRTLKQVLSLFYQSYKRENKECTAGENNLRDFEFHHPLQ